MVTSRGAPGLTPAQLRHPRFVAPSRGVRFPASGDDATTAMTVAAVITAVEASVVCDTSAARLWHLPLPPWIGLAPSDAPVGVAVASGTSRQRRSGVRGRRLRLPDQHRASIDGITVTSPARTWVDCAQFLPVEYVVAMGDAVLRRNLATRPDLEAVVRWARGRRGVRTARTALPVLDARSESPGESLTRCALLLCGIPRPECNIDIIADGDWLARADLAWPEFRVIVEYDGAVHISEAQRRHDARRRNLLQDAGWTVIVFTATDLKDPAAMAALVWAAIRRR
ncbi:MAG: endonuclease domain-containing protein [Candidatus Nanopelagicales bacterium]